MAGWSYPDTEAGILAAVAAGADHLWANTVVFGEHPLQASAALDAVQDGLYVVGHAPRVVEAVDDKHRVNEALRALQEAGLIRIEYGGVSVLDLDGLRSHR